MGVQNTRKTPKFHAHFNNPEGVNDIQQSFFLAVFFKILAKIQKQVRK